MTAKRSRIPLREGGAGKSRGIVMTPRLRKVLARTGMFLKRVARRRGQIKSSDLDRTSRDEEGNVMGRVN